MTDTQPLVPTDAEIEAVVQACRERGLRELDVFRAVVVKFGTPALVGREPVAEVVPCYTPSGKRVALYSAKQDLPIGTKLYAALAAGQATAAQPVAEPADTVGLNAAMRAPQQAIELIGTPVAHKAPSSMGSKVPRCTNLR